MSNAEITIKEVKYQIGKLDAETQFHITRRLGPALAIMGISLFQLKAGMELNLDDFAPLMGPAAQVMAEMKDADVNYVLWTALSVVKRDQMGKWAPVTTGSTESAAAGVKPGHMFPDTQTDMVLMVRLVIEVLKENLGNFLPEPSAESDSPGS